jgi:hypothetical protein
MIKDIVLLRKVDGGSTRVYISASALKSFPSHSDFEISLCDEDLHSDWGFEDQLFIGYKYRTLRASDVSQHIEIARAVRNLFTTPVTPSEDELGLIKF